MVLLVQLFRAFILDKSAFIDASLRSDISVEFLRSYQAWAAWEPPRRQAEWFAFSADSEYLIYQDGSIPYHPPAEEIMSKLLKEIQSDVRFVRSHTLQPKWYKFGKIFILLGVLGGYYALFGWRRMLIFLGVFLLLSLLLHLLYRAGTHKFTRTWLDFVVVEEEGVPRAKRIGAFYYIAILLNALIALAVSLLLG
jgi:hypothetical protein